ncbi:glycosyltransferase family 4 protein [Halopseudomonas pelagia]|uniref:glycosyltransferase family 4 protein n=1 Tax=Halopseudomonas pelagia TaxID=553151 RepID=UPI00058FE07E|nr:glycosyltransferase family 4 protein [Halopseudomonas pelagia]
MAAKRRTINGVRIVRVSTVVFFVETQLREQIAALAKAGAEVTVIASEPRLTQDIAGTQYLSIPIPRKISLFKDVSALLALWRFFRRYRPQIVHSTTPKAGLLSALAAKLAGVPVRLHTFTGQPWVGLSGVKHMLSKRSDKLITALNTHCYADSPSQKQFIVDRGVARSERISVLGTGSLAGVDLKRFNPARFTGGENLKLKEELQLPADSHILLYVGRLTADKGIVELLQAFAKVLADNADAYLILLGPSEMDVDALLSSLPAVVSQRVVMPGFSNEPERFMAIADVLVLPSYREGFGTVVIEAAAMGVPAIGTDIYGLSDAIVNGQTGLLVPVKTVDELAQAISLLLKDEPLRSTFSRNGRQRVESEFADEQFNQLIINEYERLLELCSQGSE